MKRGKREGKREKGRGKEGVPSYEQSSRDTPKKERGDPEYFIQENPRKQRKNGGGKGEKGGLSARQTPMSLTACPKAATSDRCGHVRAQANLEFQR